MKCDSRGIIIFIAWEWVDVETEYIACIILVIIDHLHWLLKTMVNAINNVTKCKTM